MPTDQKISDLTEDSSPTGADFVPLVTTGVSQTRKVSLANILALGAPATYSRSSPATRAVGGINPGDNLTGLALDAIFEKILAPYTAPTISNTVLTPAVSSYNQQTVNYSVTFRWVQNVGTPALSSAQIQYRRGTSGSWTNLTTALATINSTTEDASTTLTVNASGIDNSPVQFQCVFTDASQSNTSAIATATFAGYSAPGISFALSSGVSQAIGDGYTRELGQINTNITGTITRNSPNIALTNYQVQYRVNGAGSWINIGSPVTASGSSQSISVNHNDSGLVNATSIQYRVIVTDAEQSTISGTATVNFLYKSGLGYYTGTAASLATLLDMGNNNLTNDKGETISGVTATTSQYTYYYYKAAAGDLGAVLMDGVDSILGAFTKLSDVSGVNSYGASVTYRVYRSNSLGAFTNNTLQFLYNN